MTDKPTCGIYGYPMPEGEGMFKFHGYSGQLVVSLLTAWYAKDLRLLIPAALALANIIARIIPQPGITPQEPPHG